MTERWYAGRHPALGQYGVWLSKAGVNVRTATSDDSFLLAPSFKTEQVLQTGTIVGLAPFNSVFVPWVFSAPTPPMVYFRTNMTGSWSIDHLPFDIFQKDKPKQYWVNATVSTTGVTFSNPEPKYSIVIFYFAVARGI